MLAIPAGACTGEGAGGGEAGGGGGASSSSAGGGGAAQSGAGGGGNGSGGGSSSVPLPECDGCACEEVGYMAYETTLECFFCAYPYEPGTGPFGNGIIDQEWVYEFPDCNRKMIVAVAENPQIEHLIDTTTNEVVGAGYHDDSGICGTDAQHLHAGEPFGKGEVPGCTAALRAGSGSPY